MQLKKNNFKCKCLKLNQKWPKIWCYLNFFQYEKYFFKSFTTLMLQKPACWINAIPKLQKNYEQISSKRKRKKQKIKMTEKKWHGIKSPAGMGQIIQGKWLSETLIANEERKQGRPEILEALKPLKLNY